MPSLTPSLLATLDPKTRIRLRMSALASADYVVNLSIVFGYAIAGTIVFDVPLKLLAVAIVLNILFLGSIGTGLTRRFGDPSITAIQTCAAWGFNLLEVILAPQIAYVFIFWMSIPMSFASLAFNRRMFWIAWLGLSGALAFVMWMVGDAMSISLSTPMERVLFWAAVVVILGRFVASNLEVSRLRVRLREKNKALSVVTSELTAATGKLSDLANHDDLTALLNRREFMRRLQDELARSERSASTFCVAIIDIDFFKRVNDDYGHMVGDDVLREVARLLEATRRGTDTVARYGGEEFTLLLVGADAGAAAIALERMRANLERFDWERFTPGRRITISAGIAVWRAGDNGEGILGRADAALYEAKKGGRNCVRKAV
jgi:diguanylate cyclase (GGDEF)-like protein